MCVWWWWGSGASIQLINTSLHLSDANRRVPSPPLVMPLFHSTSKPNSSHLPPPGRTGRMDTYSIHHGVGLTLVSPLPSQSLAPHLSLFYSPSNPPSSERCPFETWFKDNFPSFRVPSPPQHARFVWSVQVMEAESLRQEGVGGAAPQECVSEETVHTMDEGCNRLCLKREEPKEKYLLFCSYFHFLHNIQNNILLLGLKP